MLRIKISCRLVKAVTNDFLFWLIYRTTSKSKQISVVLSAVKLTIIKAVQTRQAMYVEPNSEALWCNKYYISWMCVCSLRYPVCNAHAPYCNLWPVRLYKMFPNYLINGKIFEKKFLKLKCVFWFCLQILKHFSFLEKLNEIWSEMDIGLQAKCSLLLSDFNENSSTYFRKILLILNFMKIGVVGAELLRGETVMTKLNVALRNFSKAPETTKNSVC